MPSTLQTLYTGPAMRALLHAEAQALHPELGGMAGAMGLHLSMDGRTAPGTPLIGRWVRLQLEDGQLHGDLQGRLDEPLPFLDDVFSVVLLSHVQQHATHADALLGEVARVMSPNGLLVLTGVHPWSIWAPWLHWLGRKRAFRVGMRSPLHLRRRLAQLDVEVYAVRRIGAALPRAVRPWRWASAWTGGGFVLLARKRRHSVTPLRVRTARRAARVPAALAPGAHRECA